MPMVVDNLKIGGVRTLGLTYTSGDVLALTWLIRKPSTGTIQFQTDASQGGTTGDTFEIDMVSDSDGIPVGTTTAVYNAVSASFTVPSIAGGPANIRVRTVRSGVYSRAVELYPVTVANYLLLSGDEYTGTAHELLSGDTSGDLLVEG